MVANTVLGRGASQLPDTGYAQSSLQDSPATISIIVPVYNVEYYLKRCVDSLLAQSYKDIEIILVDDGSTDRSPEICDEYAAREPRVHAIHQENKGLGAARNTGLAYAHGSCIGFCDSDDYVDAHMYENLLEALITHDADIAATGLVHMLQDGTARADKALSDKAVMSSEQALRGLFQGTAIDFSSCNKLYCAHLFNELQFPEAVLDEDVFFTTRILVLANCIVQLAGVAYYYCERDNSLSKNFSEDRVMQKIEQRDNARGFVAQHYPALLADVDAYILKYLRFTFFELESLSKPLSGAIKLQLLKKSVVYLIPAFIKRSSRAQTISTCKCLVRILWRRS